MKCRIAVSVIALACPVRITSSIDVFIVSDISVRGCMILALNHNPFSQYSSRRHARKTAPFVSPISTSHFNVILYELTINRSISAIAILCTLRSETILIIRIDQTQTSCKSYRFHLINILLIIASRYRAIPRYQDQSSNIIKTLPIHLAPLQTALRLSTTSSQVGLKVLRWFGMACLFMTMSYEQWALLYHTV